MRDFKTILLAVFVAGVVAIAGLLFSINRKLDQQKNDAAPAAATAPVADAKPADPSAAADPNAAPAPPVDGVPPAPPISAMQAADQAIKQARHEKPSPVQKQESASSRPDRFADLPPRSAPPADSAPAPAKDPNGISYAKDGSTPPITAALPPPPMPEPPPSLKAPHGEIVPASVPAGPPKTITIAEGTSFRVRLIDRIDANRMHSGDTFRASLDENLIVDGMTVANRGSSVSGRLVEDKQAGRLSSGASLTLALDHLMTVAGDQSITTDQVKKDASGQGGKDAAKVGGLGALGAIIGAVAGGGKGAAIGAGAGAGAGAIDVLTSKGKDLRLGPETQLIFRLGAPVTFTVDPSRVQAASSRSSTPADNDPDRPILRRRTDP